MVNSLAKFVAFKTISSRPKFAGECNQGAAFLRRHCNYLGAHTKLLATGPDTNPIVYARFNASPQYGSDKTVLFYGHYDAVGAETNHLKWRTDPFQLTSMNGYLYGRGVTDNKGPILAALYATAELTKTRALSCNVVFLIEGEEESGSQGFAHTVRKHKDLIGDVDWILLANSYWLDDHIPCLTYGLRGVVHSNLIVTSRHPDLHSGIDGSTLLDEPLKDLTMLLGTLVGPNGKINIPGFHDPVLPLTEVEKQRYDAIAAALLPHHPEIENSDSFTNSLMHRWREPSLTIHCVEVPGCQNTSTTISRRAKATLSVRLVPNQDADEVAANLTSYAHEQFAKLNSQNTLTVDITGKAEPWLGDPDNDIFESLSRAVSEVWSKDGNERNYDYPPPGPSHAHKLSEPGLMRVDSTDSVASRVDRIISSSSSAPKASSTLPSKSSAVPTSSTLTNTSGIESRASASRIRSSAPATNLSAESRPPSPFASPSPVASPLSQTQSLPMLSTTDSASTNISPHSHTPVTSTSTTHHHHHHTTNPTQSQSQQQHHHHHHQPPSLNHNNSRPSKPIYIREGGSIPTIRFLEKEFNAPAAHLPCGQASDHAHLDNERLRVKNLYNSREIFRKVFGELGGGGKEENGKR